MRIKLPFLFLLAFLFVGCYKLDITVESANYDTRGAQVFYWVRNNSGADISRVEWCLNGAYYYSADIPKNGDNLILSDFAKRDGTRYDYAAVKPIELKAKSKAGSYSVLFADIPAPAAENTGRVALTWSPDVTAENTTADGSRVLLSVSLGSAGSKIDSAPIVEYLRGVIAEKSRADFAPYNEDNLKKELLENIKLISPDVCELLITRLEL